MNIKKRITLFFLLIICPLLGIWIFQQKYILINGETMGTTYEIKCYMPKWVTKDKVKIQVEDELKKLNAIFSTWDNDSEISKFNAFSSTKNITISDDLKYLMNESYKLYNDTTGYFDPTIKPLSDTWGFSSYNSYFTIPKKAHLKKLSHYVGLDKLILSNNVMRKLNPNIKIDLSAIVKGFAVDKLTIILDDIGSKKYMVEIGGEIRVATNKPKKPWKIGVNKPAYHQVEKSILGSVDLWDGAIATSGDYQNFFEKNGKIYSHIMNSTKGRPVESTVTSVSIFAPNCLLADGLATSVLAMGLNRGLSLIEAYPNVEGLIITREKDNSLKIYKSSGLHKVNFKLIASI